SSEKADGPENLIIRQEPAAGTRLDAGGEVTLVISEARIVPDVVGKPLEEAQALMDAEGLHFTIVEDLSDEPENTVLSCNFAAGRKADSTDSIQLMVSKPRIVPDLVGKTEQEATDLIEGIGCTVKITSVKGTEGQAEGTVISVMPQAGERVTGGSTIEITVVKMRNKELEDLSKACLSAIYNCNPHADHNVIGAGLRPYLAPSAPASDYDVWISMVKRGQMLPSEVDPVLGELPRHLDSINSITVDTDGTVHCSITVTWDWTVLGDGYEGVYSTDTRDVTLKFDENNKLTAVYDANTDVPYYEMVW
ncbi:MAG: PASTA domain-containing protein, partial [Atopobiaceae bacterium]|nr:PASTA domain-containing protein [Atopobiaceae bacterium]